MSQREGARISALRLSRRAGPMAGRGLAAAAGAGTLSIACAIGLLATSGWLLTRASQRPPVLDLAVAIGAVQAFALGRGITRYLQRLAVHGLALTTLTRLRLWLFDTVEPLVPDGLHADPGDPGGSLAGGTGSLLSGFVADAEDAAEAVAKGVTSTVDVAASIVLGTALAGLLDPASGAALLAGAAVVVALSALASRLGRSAARRRAAVRAALADSVVETLRSAPELLAFGRQDLIDERLERARRGARSAALGHALSGGVARALAIWAAGAGVIAVALAGLAAHRAGHLSGVMLTVLVLVGLAVLDQCATLPTALTGRTAGDAAATRLAGLAALPVPVQEPAAGASPPAGVVSAVLDHVEVGGGEPEATPRLRDLSLVVAPGRRVALAGPSGAGKSTALHALLHFLEISSGTASIGGVEVWRMTRSGIAGHLAWLDEDTHLFAATVGANLRLALPEASDAECDAVLDRVGMGRWRRSLPDGLATVIGSGGRPVSAGERQRLGMARALLSGATLLLLDEPTAHLDPESAPEVLAELLGAAGSRSVLLVSHDAGVAADVDEVVMLDRGRVVARQPAA